MNDLLPGGGYQELISDGFVLYIEIAIDFSRAAIWTLDLFHPRVLAGRRDGLIHGAPQTLYLNSRTVGTPSFCAYDKRRESLPPRGYRFYRREVTRIEARWRLNNSPRLRNICVRDLGNLENPFTDLSVVGLRALRREFASPRDADFLRQAQSHGIQRALDESSLRARERRIRMLSQTVSPWWNPEALWAGRHRAFASIVTLSP